MRKSLQRIVTTSVIITMLLITAPLNSLSAQRGMTRRVRFARGRTSAVLRGAVVRATTDRYILGAQVGQTMIVHLTSLERNAVFNVCVRGDCFVTEASDWSGDLTRSGNYVIEVSPTRGNATYTLEVTIR